MFKFLRSFVTNKYLTLVSIVVLLTYATIENILEKMKHNPKNISFNNLCKVCDFYFGNERQSGSSHRIYKTPWQGNPRVNIQNSKGKAKPYQVRQILQAIERLEVENG